MPTTSYPHEPGRMLSAPNVRYSNCSGVSAVYHTTRRLAYHAGNMQPGTALDMGTGTGFIALYLQSLGCKCAAVDISERALKCARMNAAKNRMTLQLIHGDLFNGVTGMFDLVIFNTPLTGFAAPYGFVSKCLVPLEYLGSWAPRGSAPLNSMFLLINKRRRRVLVRRFLDGARQHLREGGVVMMLLHEKELDLAQSWEVQVLEGFDELYCGSSSRELLVTARYRPA